MFLILFLVLIAVAGFYLARRNFDKQTVQTTRNLTAKARDVSNSLGARFKNLMGGEKQKTESFSAWVAEDGASDLPDDFKDWFNSLNVGEQNAFSKALSNYMDGLGLSLTTLTSGRLDKQPDFKQVFVETLVIYSNTYRKIAEVKEKSEDKSSKTEADSQNNDAEVRTAEKAKSRRSTEPHMETAPAAS